MARPKRIAARKNKKRAVTRRSRPAGPSVREVAIRSRAFGKAILNAKPYMLNAARLEELVRQAAIKSVSLPTEPFRDSWAYFHTMLRLLRAHQRGEYTAAPSRALLSIVAAVAYLVDPIDLIPDEIPHLGFLDDATVLEFAMIKTRPVLDEFMAWELRRLLPKQRT
jgi:uncharacterized membrane protein YkvA (DUF1232 family)